MKKASISTFNGIIYMVMYNYDDSNSQRYILGQEPKKTTTTKTDQLYVKIFQYIVWIVENKLSKVYNIQRYIDFHEIVVGISVLFIYLTIVIS